MIMKTSKVHQLLCNLMIGARFEFIIIILYTLIFSITRVTYNQ